MNSILESDPEVNQLRPPQNYQEYDPFKIPPDIQVAIQHGNATKYGENRVNGVEDIKKCPCCGLVTDVDELGICLSHKALYYNGPGVALYFDFILFCIYILTIYGFVAGIYNIRQNYEGNRCLIENIQQTIDYCDSNFYNILSLSNRTEQNDDIGNILNFLANIIVLISTVYYQKMISSIAKQIDDSVVTVSDYSVMVTNIPSDATENEIFLFFDKDTNNVEGVTSLKKITLGYDIAPYLAIQDLQQLKQQEFTQFMNNENSGELNEPQIKPLREELVRLEEQVKAMEHNFSQFKFSGVCFISFNTEDEADSQLKLYKANKLTIMFKNIISIFKDVGKKFRGNSIHVVRAPEPGDVLWQNLGIDLWLEFKKKMITTLATFFVLAICFGIILGAQLAQSYTEAIDKNDQTYQKQIGITIFGLGASLLISVINLVLASVIRRFAHYERHPTQTEFNISVAKKLGIAQFLNTTIITLMANIIANDNPKFIHQIWKTGGLNYDVNLILMTNAVFSWVSVIFDPDWILNLYKKSKIIKEGDKCILNQKEANSIFEGTEVDLAQKYAQIAKTIMLTFFYAYLLPIGVVFSILSLILQYWVEKLMLLKRDKKPPSLSNELAEEMVEFYIIIVMMLQAAGCCVWEAYVFGIIRGLSLAQLGVAVFFYISPLDDILQKFQKKKLSETVETYEEAKHKFWDDYDRRNPLSMEDALKAWVNHDVSNEISKDNLENPIQSTKQNVNKQDQKLKNKFKSLKSHHQVNPLQINLKDRKLNKDEKIKKFTDNNIKVYPQVENEIKFFQMVSIFIIPISKKQDPISYEIRVFYYEQVYNHGEFFYSIFLYPKSSKIL